MQAGKDKLKKLLPKLEETSDDLNQQLRESEVRQVYFTLCVKLCAYEPVA